MKELFLFSLSMIILKSSAQNHFSDTIFIKDSARYLVLNFPNAKDDVKTLCFLAHKKEDKNILLLNDSLNNKVLYKKITFSDTIFHYNYWSNGTLAKMQKVDSIGRLLECIYLDSNANLIFTEKLTKEGMILTGFYLGGSKMFSINTSQYKGYKQWFENGVLQIEGEYYSSERVKNGKWIYYKNNGELDRIEFYKDNNLLEVQSP